MHTTHWPYWHTCKFTSASVIKLTKIHSNIYICYNDKAIHTSSFIFYYKAFMYTAMQSSDTLCTASYRITSLKKAPPFSKKKEKRYLQWWEHQQLFYKKAYHVGRTVWSSHITLANSPLCGHLVRQWWAQGRPEDHACHTMRTSTNLSNSNTQRQTYKHNTYISLMHTQKTDTEVGRQSSRYCVTQVIHHYHKGQVAEINYIV